MFLNCSTPMNSKLSFLHFDTCDLYYEVTGKGPALMFAHGIGGNQLSWWQQVPYFQHRYTCITFAHRGFYPSKELSQGRGALAFVDDLTALINHLGLKDVRLVAQSMGGITCLGYTLRNLTRVRALVLAGSVASVNHPKINSILSQHNLTTIRKRLKTQNIHPAAGERMSRENPALHFLYKEIDRLSIGLDKDHIRDQLETMRIIRPDSLQPLNVPVLCISGEEDVVMPTQAVEVLAAILPNATFNRVPKTGHSVYFERPNIFNRLVDDFIGNCF